MKSNPSIEISVKDLHRKLQNNQELHLIDVRSEEAFLEWNIFHSKNIPLSKLSAESFPEDYKNRQIVTICGRGKDSKLAAMMLQDLGFNASSLQGGLTEWNNVFDKVDIPIDNSQFKLIQFRRIAKGCLSYIISNNGEAVVIDPAQNIEPYLTFTETNGLEIKYIFDTHWHADHISGARKLAEVTDSKLHLSNKDPFEFDYTPINYNETLRLGNQPLITPIHTPGHTRGSTTIRIKNFGIFTGDIVFADGIGRPDLADNAREFAGNLFDSMINQIATFPKEMIIAPAHHGKFVKNHFYHPIMTTVEKFSKDEVLKMNKVEFINFAVKKVNALPRPPSYRTILQINAGKLLLSKEQIIELEIGPNRCAMG